MILDFGCGDVGYDSIITIDISSFLIENRGPWRCVLGPVSRHCHSPKLDISYIFKTRPSHPSHPYYLSFGYAVRISYPISLRFHHRVFDMIIDLIVDWTICHCLVIVSSDWSLDDHPFKTYWMNSIITAQHPMQIADLETFLWSIRTPIRRQFLFDMRFKLLIASRMIVFIAAWIARGSADEVSFTFAFCVWSCRTS